MPTIRVLRRDGLRNLPPMRLAAGLVLLVVALVFTTSTWFQVESNAMGVVTRFGKLARVVGPGLQWKLPLGFEAETIVPTRHVHKMEFGFRSYESASSARTRYDEREFPEESSMLTGDLNAAQVEWIVQYRIDDPIKYLFRVRDPEATLRDLARAVMSEVVGDHSVLEVLTEGRREVNAEAQTELQKLVDQYEMGLAIETVQLQNVDPPPAVRASFNDVNQSEQMRERTINEAWQEYNQKIPLAEGEAQKVKQQAEGYAIDRTNRATGEAGRFLALVAEYDKAPEVMRRRLWLETLGEVLPKLGRKIVIDPDLKGLVPLLPLGDVPLRESSKAEGVR